MKFENNNLTPRKRKLLHLIKHKDQKINKQKRQLYYYKSKLSRKDAALNKILAQAKHNLKKRQYSNYDLNLAKTLYFVSSNAYQILRRQGVVLPALSTLQREISRLKVEAGFSFTIIETLCRNIKQKYPDENSHMQGWMGCSQPALANKCLGSPNNKTLY